MDKCIRDSFWIFGQKVIFNVPYDYFDNKLLSTGICEKFVCFIILN